MIEIAISSDLANEHPRFIADCRQHGHRVKLFGDRHEPGGSPVARTPDPDQAPDEAYIGKPHPARGDCAECTGTVSTDPDDFCGCPICQAAAAVHINARGDGARLR